MDERQEHCLKVLDEIRKVVMTGDFELSQCGFIYDMLPVPPSPGDEIDVYEYTGRRRIVVDIEYMVDEVYDNFIKTCVTKTVNGDLVNPGG